MPEFKFSANAYIAAAKAISLNAPGCVDAAFDILAKDVQQQIDAPKRKWYHLKRGTKYVENDRAKIQIATTPPVEGDVVVVYRGENGDVYCRKQEEFEDGRFKEII